MNKTKIFHLK